MFFVGLFGMMKNFSRPWNFSIPQNSGNVFFRLLKKKNWSFLICSLKVSLVNQCFFYGIALKTPFSFLSKSVLFSLISERMKATDLICNSKLFPKHILKDAIQVLIFSQLSFLVTAFTPEECCHSCYHFCRKNLLFVETGNDFNYGNIFCGTKLASASE